MKKTTAIILILIFFFSIINVYAIQTQMSIENIEYLNSRVDNALVPIKLNQLPVTTNNGNGVYGAGVIIAKFNLTELEYIGIKTGSMVSSKGGKSIYWVSKSPNTVNADGEIRLYFSDSTADSSKSYGEGSFEAENRDVLLYLEFKVLDKTVGKKLAITLVDGQLSGSVIIPKSATSDEISMPSLMSKEGNLDIESGDITITEPLPTTSPIPIPIPSSSPTPIPIPTPTPNHPSGGGRNPSETSNPVIAKAEHYPYIKGYPDSTFKTENNITRAEIATIISRLSDGFKEDTVYSPKFSDVDTNKWFANYIGFSQDKGVIVGYTDGEFKPAENITRAEFATMVARFKALDYENEIELPFSDVMNHWSTKYLSSIYKKRYILGYPDGTFAPDQPITRAEAVAIINRAIDRTPNKTNPKIDTYTNPFSDVVKTHWAYYDILESAIKHNVEDFH